MSLLSAAISLSFAVGGMLLAQVDTDAPAAPQLAFDVASIRQNTMLGGRIHIYNDPHNGEFRTANAPLKMILEYAYGLPQTQIVGGPAWVDSAKFDMDAKAELAVSEALGKMESTAVREAKRGMVRALLEDRFGLVVHKETREMPIFKLVVAKGGPKIEKTDTNGSTVNEGRDHMDVIGSDHTVALLCESLAKRTGRVVVDETGLDGRYKIALKWTPDDVAAAGRSGADAPPDLFTAIQEQLGLKLEPAKGPVPVLAIDKVTMPTEN
jgi:uncharacterized protein (TIGR03435 family)